MLKTHHILKKKKAERNTERNIHEMSYTRYFGIRRMDGAIFALYVCLYLYIILYIYYTFCMGRNSVFKRTIYFYIHKPYNFLYYIAWHTFLRYVFNLSSSSNVSYFENWIFFFIMAIGVYARLFVCFCYNCNI